MLGRIGPPRVVQAVGVNMKATRWLPILMCLPLVAVRGHDFSFTSGRSAICIPFEASNRHIAFQARLNERDGMRVVLDTGAGGSVIDAKRAESLGLQANGTQHARGSGGSEMGSTVRGVDVALPGFELLDQTMSTLALGPIAAQAGRPLDAILGHPLLSRCVVEIDYPRHCVSLHDAADYKYGGAGVSVPITFKENLPYVKASVVLPNGRSISGKFVIDTGASTNLILSPESVEREGVAACRRKDPHGTGARRGGRDRGPLGAPHAARARRFLACRAGRGASTGGHGAHQLGRYGRQHRRGDLEPVQGHLRLSAPPHDPGARSGCRPPVRGRHERPRSGLGPSRFSARVGDARP